MQSSRDTITMAGAQLPLLHQHQLEVGLILTGVAMTHLWEIVGITDGQLEIVKFPKPSQLCREGGHSFGAVYRGHACATCGLRKEAITEFMPLKPGKARVHVISANGRIQTPTANTVYGALTGVGALKLFHLRGDVWNEPLPVFPELHKIWEIPQSLQAYMTTFDALEPVAQEE